MCDRSSSIKMNTHLRCYDTNLRRFIENSKRDGEKCYLIYLLKAMKRFAEQITQNVLLFLNENDVNASKFAFPHVNYSIDPYTYYLSNLTAHKCHYSYRIFRFLYQNELNFKLKQFHSYYPPFHHPVCQDQKVDNMFTIIGIFVKGK